MKARVHVTLKNGVLDPQGKAIGHSLNRLGFPEVGDVRQGKFIELELAETDKAKAKARARGHVQEAARQHGDRELLDRAGRLMKAAVLVFPGSNREGDVAQAIELVTGRKPQMVWHGDGDFEKTDLIVLPGGFSYGDYLRCGAMAAQSPVMAEVKTRAGAGRAGARHLQRLPDRRRGGAAAGRADAQRARSSSSAATCTSRSRPARACSPTATRRAR